LACQREIWDRCINTSERTRGTIDYGAALPHALHATRWWQRAKSIGLDPAYVYGLIRQESRFIMDARSHVGASGLMQVMPATAKWTAKRIGLTDFRAEHITDRDTNIAIGTGLPEAGAGRLRRFHAHGRCRLQRGPRPPTGVAPAARHRCWTPPSGPRTSRSAKRVTT
jgi:hypothetical protein